MTQVSIIIPSWNTRTLLRETLESLKTTMPMSSEIIVVDNGSTDGTVRMLQDQFQHVRLIKNTTNMGYAVASNQGIEAARGAYVLLLNSDTQVVGNAIRSMVAFLERNLRYGAVAPRLRNPDGSTQAAHMRFPTLLTPLFFGTPLERWWPESRELRRYFARDFDYDTDSDVEQPPAACLLMRRRALKHTKPLDESLWLFYNDVDLCKRLWESGWRIRYLESAHVFHHGGASTRQYRDFVAEYHKNRLAYYRKHHGRAAGAWVKLCVAWTVIDHCVRELWHRAQGLPEQPLLPLWQTFQVFLKH
jgi:GT2 family glycosyltransferase